MQLACGGRLHSGRSGSIAPRDGRLAPQGRLEPFHKKLMDA